MNNNSRIDLIRKEYRELEIKLYWLNILEHEELYKLNKKHLHFLLKGVLRGISKLTKPQLIFYIECLLQEYNEVKHDDYNLTEFLAKTLVTNRIIPEKD